MFKALATVIHFSKRRFLYFRPNFCRLNVVMLHILDLLQLFLLQGVPLLYVPLEVIMSKYYGESERLLGNVFSLANELQNGAIIFLDEVHCTLYKTKLHMLN